MNMKKTLRSELTELLSEIWLHECYFNSFASRGTSSEILKELRISENSFRYEMLLSARESETGFLCLFLRAGTYPDIKICTKSDVISESHPPLLAIDLCEHAYFLDYGYRREEYLRAAIARLDLSKLSGRPLTQVK